MTTRAASQIYVSYECSLLDRRFRQVQTSSLDATSISAAILSGSAILQHQLADQVDLVGFELRRNGVRVRTCLESLRTVVAALSTEAGESPHGSCSVFNSRSIDTL